MSANRISWSNAIRWHKMTLVTWFFASACPALTFLDVSGDPPHTEEHIVRLAPLPGFADEEAFRASLTGRIAELQRQASESPNAMRKAGCLLAAANIILAEQLEPSCSRKFLMVKESNLPPNQPQQSADASSAGPALGRADALLAEAESILQSAQEPTVDENSPPTDPAMEPTRGPTARDSTFEPDQARSLNRALVALKAFAQALRVYLLIDADEDIAGDGLDSRTSAARNAASALSIIMEDDDSRTAAAASFWQASLRAMEIESAPALVILNRATVDLPADAPRFGFYSRLLRCRLVAAQDGWAAALSLLMQVEERANLWFKDETELNEAVRSCAWFRLRVLQDWLDHLDPSAQPDERAWCESQIETLRNERFSTAQNGTVLRLNQAIPIIALPPETSSKTAVETPTPR